MDEILTLSTSKIVLSGGVILLSAFSKIKFKFDMVSCLVSITAHYNIIYIVTINILLLKYFILLIFYFIITNMNFKNTHFKNFT